MSPPRRWPKRKSCPAASARTPSRPTSTSAHERLRRELHQPGVEAEDVEDLDPEIAEELDLAPQRGQAGGGTVRMQHLARVWLEGDDAEGCSQLAGECARRVEHGPVPAVNPVEIADRHRRTEPSPRCAGASPDNAHGRVSSMQAVACKADSPRPRPRGHSPQLVLGAGRRGTNRTASPSSTFLPSTLQAVSKMARFFSRSTVRKVTSARTVSPERTGARKRMVWLT